MEKLNIETEQKEKELIKKFIDYRYPKEPYEDLGQMAFLRDADDRTLTKFFKWIKVVYEEEEIEEVNFHTLPVWLARDIDGELWLYFEEPELSRNGVYWYSKGKEIRLPKDKFPDITKEKGPVRVNISLSL